MEGYEFTLDDLPTLLKGRYYPEIPRPESAVIADFLEVHGGEYDRFVFSARLGDGLAPDPTHLPGVQFSTEFSTKKRCDLLLYQGPRPTILEAKIRVSADAFGKVHMYFQEFVKEFPDAPEPALVVVGRYSDPIILELLASNGVTVYLYETADGR